MITLAHIEAPEAAVFAVIFAVGVLVGWMAARATRPRSSQRRVFPNSRS